MLAWAGLVILLVIASGAAWGVYVVTRRSLRSLLDGVVRRAAATEFYLRAFLICLVFGAFGGALQNEWNPASGKPFMEHVWPFANALSSVMYWMLTVLLCFTVMISILVATLGRKPTEPPVCLKCGYSLKGQIDNIRCPECGEHYVGTGNS